MKRAQFLKPTFYFSPITLFLMLTLWACNTPDKSVEIKISLEEIPEKPKWYYIFLTNRDSGRTSNDRFEYTFGGGNVVMIDTNDPGLPDSIQIYHGGKALDKEIRENLIGLNDHKGIRYYNYSTMVVSPDFQFVDSMDGHRRHSDYWYYMSQKTLEIKPIVEKIFSE